MFGLSDHFPGRYRS